MEVIEYQRKGRFYFEHYIGNMKVLTRSILSAIRYRLQMRSKVSKKIPTKILRTISNSDQVSFNVGKHSNSALLPLDYHTAWNYDPTHLETDNLSPVRSIFYPTNILERAPGILKANGDYHNNLGGNMPAEKYTIIVNAFKRDEQLHFSLKRLKNLKFLDLVIVVWCDIQREPPPEEWWPKLEAPLIVINATENTLHSRYFPWDIIKTEAIFQMDDDFEAEEEVMEFMF
uniref:Glycosyl transferase 64 domain-containing protein n=1 Tax=Acrobeloides nanus TaxID=290746 RepID=A0A914CZ64_9BILA